MARATACARSAIRARLIAGDAEERLLNTLLTAFQAWGLLKAGGRQRTDSTHALANLRDLNRLELVGETLRYALNALARVAPEWVRGLVPAEWYVHYGCRFDSFHLPEARAARDELMRQIRAWYLVNRVGRFPVYALVIRLAPG